MMKNPFNILNGIVFTILVSIIGLFALIIFSGTLDFGLIEEDYYEKGLQYQDQIDRINRSNALTEPVEILTAGEFIIITFPKLFNPDDVSGEIHFFRPSDPKLDKSLLLVLNESGKQEYNISKLKSGLWIVKLDWTYQDTEYFKEQRIFLNN